MDAVSSLITHITCSLKSGLIRRRLFVVPFRRDVFNYLFNNRGISVGRKPGKLYNRSDFSNAFFCDNNFMYKNNHDEVARILFPICMYSHVKFVKLSSDSCDYCEVIRVKLCKEYVV